MFEEKVNADIEAQVAAFRAELESKKNEVLVSLLEGEVAAKTERVAGLNAELEQAEAELATAKDELASAQPPVEVQEVAAEVAEEVQG